MDKKKVVDGLEWHVDKLDGVTDVQGFAVWKETTLCFLTDVYGEESQQKKSLFNLGLFEMTTKGCDVSKLKDQAKTLLEGLVAHVGFTE
jgi:hypothetical protein